MGIIVNGNSTFTIIKKTYIIIFENAVFKSNLENKAMKKNNNNYIGNVTVIVIEKNHFTKFINNFQSYTSFLTGTVNYSKI